MRKIVLFMGGVAIAAGSQASGIVAQWNFNDGVATEGSILADVGTGSLNSFGVSERIGVSGTTEGGSSDPDSPNLAMSLRVFPGQGSGSGTAGFEVSVSTLGLENVFFRLDQRNQSRASRHWSLEVSTDAGVSYTTVANTVTDVTDWINNREFDLNSVSGIADNEDVRIRYVSIFAPGTSQYEATDSGTTYGPTNSARFDMVTVSAEPIPEPATLLALGFGAAALASRRKRSR